ncbi:hypothetical protein [Rhodococcoides kyotonense]|nr:hypothetical protein [Rhodococcus kyotonensis]
MTTHEHAWTTTSRHDTSEGRVTYQHCTCGAQQILASHFPERGRLAVIAP